jgi:excisionase family DNA binding protein
MTALLTTRDVQELINVDKSTIYRMAEDGRLPAVKVGRQWRFPASAVASLLGEGASTLARTSSLRRSRDLRELLVPEAAQAIADLVGDLFGLMAVVTDIEGGSLTSVANPCGYFAAIETQPGAVDQCIEGWRRLGSELDLEPRFLPTHLGFQCARSFIRIGNRLAGMVIVGGITPEDGPLRPERLADIARESGISLDLLTAHATETYDLDPERRAWVLTMLPRVGDLISRLASAQGDLINHFDALAGLSGEAPRTQGATT